MGQTLGQYGKGSGKASHHLVMTLSLYPLGKFRAPDKKQKHGALTKKMKKKLEREQARGGSMSSIRRATATTAGSAGTASVAFTPIQV